MTSDHFWRFYQIFVFGTFPTLASFSLLNEKKHLTTPFGFVFGFWNAIPKTKIFFSQIYNLLWLATRSWCYFRPWFLLSPAAGFLGATRAIKWAGRKEQGSLHCLIWSGPKHTHKTTKLTAQILYKSVWFLYFHSSPKWGFDALLH